MRGRWYAATGILAVLVVGACSQSSGGGGSDAASGAGGLAPVHGAAMPGAQGKPVYGVEDRSAAGVAVNGGALSSAGGGRVVSGSKSLPLVDGIYKIQTARMTVAVKGAPNVAAKANEATQLVEQVGGEVDADNRTSGARATATMLLRVPPDALNDTLTALSKLGTEKDRTLSTTDVTQKVADVSSRVESAQRSIIRLRTLFDHAKKVSDIIALESELNSREADLESLQAQQRALSRQTSMASITLNLFTATKAPAPPKPEKKDDDSGFVGGLKRGWDGFTAAAAWVAEAVGTLLPFIVLLLVLGFVLRVLRPRLPHLPRRSAPTPAPSE